MNILVLGSGGREHALAWKIKQSPLVGRVYAAPGNAGIAQVAECVALDMMDGEAIAVFCREKAVDLVMVGPEAPLVTGVADVLRDKGIAVFGPDAGGAQLEGSKKFTKELCAKYHIPTAAYGSFTDADAAKAYVREQGAPIVVKADGLAAGKGVIIAETVDEACAAVDEMFGGAFGEAGQIVVIEAFMEGEEVSLFALLDGKKAVAFGSAQDHKRVGDGDTGPNTGGMGTYAPAPVFTPELERQVMETIIQPTADALAAEGYDYRGVLFAGLMLTKDGPQLLEYNIRFGDPETQVLMRRLESDIVPFLKAVAEGDLGDMEPEWARDAALCVVMAAKGYPGSYEKGTEIRDVEAAEALPDVVVFHAGTKRDGEKLLATGGRVLNVTALGNSVAEAQRKTYAAVDAIRWEDGFCRRDIGWRAA